MYQKQNQKHTQQTGWHEKKSWKEFFNKKSKEENSTALQKAKLNLEICKGNKQCDLQERKKILKVIVLFDCGVCPCGWGWISVLWCFPGWGSLWLCSSWWSRISSLWRAAQCPVVGFGESMGSVCLWAVLLDLAVWDTSISAVASKWPNQHIFTATSPLFVPGIFASAPVPWPYPALQAEGCQVGACVDLFSAPWPCPLHHGGLCGLPSAPWACLLCRRACVH